MGPVWILLSCGGAAADAVGMPAPAGAPAPVGLGKLVAFLQGYCGWELAAHELVLPLLVVVLLVLLLQRSVLWQRCPPRVELVLEPQVEVTDVMDDDEDADERRMWVSVWVSLPACRPPSADCIHVFHFCSLRSCCCYTAAAGLASGCLLHHSSSVMPSISVSVLKAIVACCLCPEAWPLASES